MVATISTRGSSEGLLGVMVVALLWAVMQKRITIAGLLLGLGVHFKIYPFIYAPSIIWWLDDERLGLPRLTKDKPTLQERIAHFVNGTRFKLAVTSLITFIYLNVVMYLM